MTIIELVIAFAILMAVLVPIAILLGNTIGQAASSRERLTALSLAEQYLEKLNNTPVLKHTATTAPTAHAALETTNDPTVPKTSDTIKITSLVRSTIAYSIYARFTWALHESTTLDLCTSGTAPTLLDLQVTVEWGRAQQKITDTTLIDFPATGILTEGFLAVNVFGDPHPVYGDPGSGPPKDAQTHAWSTRVKAVPVTISPGPTVTTGFSTITRHPNQYGCVFQEVPAGTYSVKVADPTTGTPPGTHYGTPSWASSDGELLSETSPSPGATVTVGEVATVTFQYDEGAMAKVTYPSTTVVEGPVWCPGVGAIDCLAAGQSPASTKAPSTAPAAVLSVLSSSGWHEYKTAATRLVASACAKRCISVGTAQTGTAAHGAAVSSSTSTVDFTPDTVPTGVSSLTDVTCTTTARCYAYGSGGSGAVILTATVGSTSVSWRSGSGLSGVTSVQSLDCPKKTTCYAAAATITGPAILSLSGGAWVRDTLPSTVTAVTEVVCRTSVCFAIGSSSTGAVILSQKVTSATTWVADTIPAASSLTSIDCLSGTQCYAIGKAASGPTIDSLSGVTGTTVTWTADTFASTPKLSSLTVLECRGSTCVATGTTSTGPAIVSLYTSTSTWRADGIPAGVTAVTSLACPSGTQCEATAVATVTGAPGAVVLSLSSTTGTWTTDTFPPGTDPLYLAGVACSAKTSMCAAPGATATDAVLLSSTLSGTTWQRAAPVGVTGMYVGDTPIAVYNPGLSPTETVEVASPTPTTGDVGSIGPLFPFSSGYQVGATACAAGITSTAPSVTSVPGTTFTAKPTGTRVPTAALPMGLLPVEVLSRTGTPVAGATVTIEPTCTRLTAPTGQSDQTSFALGTTDGSGTTGLAVMYGTYVVTVTYGSTAPVTATVTVSKTSITVGTTTTTLPSPGVIRL